MSDHRVDLSSIPPSEETSNRSGGIGERYWEQRGLGISHLQSLSEFSGVKGRVECLEPEEALELLARAA